MKKLLKENKTLTQIVNDHPSARPGGRIHQSISRNLLPKIRLKMKLPQRFLR